MRGAEIDTWESVGNEKERATGRLEIGRKEM